MDLYHCMVGHYRSIYMKIFIILFGFVALETLTAKANGQVLPVTSEEQASLRYNESQEEQEGVSGYLYMYDPGESVWAQICYLLSSSKDELLKDTWTNIGTVACRELGIGNFKKGGFGSLYQPTEYLATNFNCTGKEDSVRDCRGSYTWNFTSKCPPEYQGLHLICEGPLPTNLKQVSTNTDSIELEWDMPIDPDYPIIIGYQFELNDTSHNKIFNHSINYTSPSAASPATLTLSKLSENTEYIIRLRAKLNPNGILGPNSNYSSFKTSSYHKADNIKWIIIGSSVGGFGVLLCTCIFICCVLYCYRHITCCDCHGKCYRTKDDNNDNNSLELLLCLGKRRDPRRICRRINRGQQEVRERDRLIQ